MIPKSSSVKLELADISNMDEFDVEDQNDDELFTFGKKVKIEIGDMDYKSWRVSLAKDREVLALLIFMVGDITPEHDSKLQELYRVIKDKQEHPINKGKIKEIRRLLSSLRLPIQPVICMRMSAGMLKIILV